ncbi:LuxR C-terminal-related transcriptional regulator [Thalassolituus maritimus]|uniref:LuxR C-terminal-related transcriptional regulator n=1 Tax=Thalassolituus maritimus TaxID=484498 RepID=UPI00333F6D8D
MIGSVFIFAKFVTDSDTVPPRVSETEISQSALLVKTAPPAFAHRHIDRSDILMRELSSSPVVMMLAPAGYGKTSVISAALPALETEHRVVFYQCDQFDESPHWLVEACAQVLGFTSLTGLSRSDVSDTEIVARLLEQIRLLEEPVALILDNIESLTYEESRSILTLMLRYRPANLRLVFSGRQLPFAHGALRLLDDIRWISTPVLSFNFGEFKALLEHQQLPLPAGEVAALLRKMQGWPAGLALWLMAWRGAGMPDRWGGELGLYELSDYLRGEVASHLSEPQRNLLCLCAVLGTFNDDLIGAVSPEILLAGDLQALLHAGLYLREVPGRPEWYRVEPMVAQCLSRLQPQEWRRGVHLRAFEWFRERDDAIAALYHAGQSEQGAIDSEWIVQQSDTILASLDTQGLTVWFDQLNEDQLYSSPALMQVACWTDLLTNRLDKAQNMIERLATLPDLDEAGHIALKGYLAGARGALTRAERHCRQALEMLTPERFSVRFLMASMLASVSVAHRDLDGSRIWNRFALDVARKSRQNALEGMAHLDHARIEFNRGHASRCLTVLTQGREVLEASPHGSNSLAYARLLILKATVGWITGYSDEPTDSAIAHALMLCEERSDPAAAYGYAIRALNLMGQGQYALALNVLDDGERRLQEQQVDFVAYAWLHTVRSNIWISQKKFRRAHDCLEALLVDADSAGVARCEYSALLPGFSTLTLSRLHLMAGRAELCLEITDRWLRHTPEGFMSVFIRMIRAGALMGQQQPAEAMRQLEVVKKTFRAEGVNQQLQSWLPGLVAFLDIPQASLAPATEQASALSERERDVLNLMAQGLSNQAVADQLYISLHTVKTHARKINVKLGTRSRTQAIHKAKELMLI